MKISIITATRQDVDTLPDCLASVAGQSYPDREHIVIVGTSTDGTLAVLEAHRPQLAALVSEPDQGLYEALNKGLALATGDVVGFLHADDLFADANVLARIAAAFATPTDQGTVEAVYGDLVYVAKENTGRVIRYWRSGEFQPARLRWGWMPPHPTLYLRRSVLQRLGGFDPCYRIAADYDLILRMLGGGGGRPVGQVVYLHRVLVRMRVGGTSNRSLSKILLKSREDYRALRANGIGGFGALAWKNLSKLPQFFHNKEKGLNKEEGVGSLFPAREGNVGDL